MASRYFLGSVAVSIFIAFPRLERHLEGDQLAVPEAHGAQEFLGLGLARVDQRAQGLGPGRAEMRRQRLEQLAPESFAALRGIDAEALDPAARFLEPELAAAHVAQHEPDNLAVHLGHAEASGSRRR